MSEDEIKKEFEVHFKYLSEYINLTFELPERIGNGKKSRSNGKNDR